MSLYHLNEKSLYFIHIPRTSGRYVRSLIESTPSISCHYNIPGQDYIRGRDVVHLHYPLYEHFLPTYKIPQITIVRNPIDKFISCIKVMCHMHHFDYNFIMKTKEEFDMFVWLNIDALSFQNNWFLPQHRFTSSITKVWKYEDGINEDFVDWVREETGMQISKDFSVNYDKINGEEESFDYKMDEHIKDYIVDFYKEDFLKFGYTF